MSNAELTNKVHDLRSLKAMLEEIQAEIDTIQDGIKAHMNMLQTDTLLGSDYKITYKTVKSTRIDTAALKKHNPDIAAQYTRETESKRFCIA